MNVERLPSPRLPAEMISRPGLTDFHVFGLHGNHVSFGFRLRRSFELEGFRMSLSCQVPKSVLRPPLPISANPSKDDFTLNFLPPRERFLWTGCGVLQPGSRHWQCGALSPI